MSHRRTCYACGRWRGCELHDRKHTYTEWDSRPSAPGFPERLHVESINMAMEKSRRAGGDGLPTLFVDEAFSAEYPALYEWMRELRWDDGTVRRTGAFMLTVDGEYLKAWVHDRDGKRSAWVSGNTLVDVLSAVEVGLSTGRLEWRADKR